MEENIFDIARRTNKTNQLVVARTRWSDTYCIVDTIELKENSRYGQAFGTIYYPDGNILKGKIPNAGCLDWYLIGILKESEGKK